MRLLTSLELSMSITGEGTGSGLSDGPLLQIEIVYPSHIKSQNQTTKQRIHLPLQTEPFPPTPLLALLLLAVVTLVERLLDHLLSHTRLDASLRSPKHQSQLCHSEGE